MRRQHSKAARRPAYLSRRGNSTSSFHTRPLRFESLEDRRLLAITVNTLVDELDGSILDGDISLRDAIAASPTGGEINFSVTGTIGLSLGQLTIDKDLTITGPGANLLTINAGNGTDDLPATLDGYRIFNIDNGSASLINVAISGLTLTGGDTIGQGGAILNRENFTLTASTVSGNAADGGGGVANSGGGTLAVTISTISGNRAGNAGGIGNFNGGTVILTGSTVASNQAGGGVFGLGGGVYSRDAGTLTITGSTISGNSSGAGGGGISIAYSTATITGSTISGNSAESGGGVNVFIATATIVGSLITGNSASAGSEITNFGTVNLNAFNLIGDSSKTTTQALYGAGSAGATDILATSNGTNPRALAAIIAPLANNGGPTQTHALVAGGPAINAGDPGFTSPPNFDQRGAGYQRVVNGRVDIGAFELQISPGDFDFDYDVDGRDFLLWQRGGSPTPFSSADLGDWQEYYGEPAILSALSADAGDSEALAGSRPEQAVAQFRQVSDQSPELVLLVPAYSTAGQASSGTLVVDDSYVEEVDLAMEQLATWPSSVCSFGEMVARRSLVKRFDAGRLE